MGQYHSLVNVDKKEIVNPHQLGMGAKQYEHTGFIGSLSDVLYTLVTTSPARGGGDYPLTEISGRWVGDRVLVVGDYTEATDFPEFPNLAAEIFGEDGNYTDISEMCNKAMEEVRAKY